MLIWVSSVLLVELFVLAVAELAVWVLPLPVWSLLFFMLLASTIIASRNDVASLVAEAKFLSAYAVAIAISDDLQLLVSFHASAASSRATNASMAKSDADAPGLMSMQKGHPSQEMCADFITSVNSLLALSIPFLVAYFHTLVM